MNTNEERPWELVTLGATSSWRNDLNKGVASLQKSDRTQIRPHVCINGLEGAEVIQKISADPDREDTGYFIYPHLNVSGSDVWLNVKFAVVVERMVVPTNLAGLSPQQTGYIVRNLPPTVRDAVTAQVKSWYLKVFLPDIQKGLDFVTKQFETGDPVQESDRGNRIFDIHGGRHLTDIPYTETDIVGEKLYAAIIHGGTFFEYGSDGYERADALISGRRSRQQAAVHDFLGAMRGLRR